MSKEFIPNFVEVVQTELNNSTFINDKGQKEILGTFVNDYGETVEIIVGSGSKFSEEEMAIILSYR